MLPDLQRAIEASLDAEVADVASVGGGDVAIAYRLTLDDGRTVFAKTHDDPPPGFFVTEASGLRWLDEVAGVNVVPVLAVSDEPAFLVLGWIEEGDAVATTEADFGLALASLHRAGAPTFGREDLRTTGSLRMPNEPAGDWATFYGQSRLLPLANRAERWDALDPTTIGALRSLAGRLHDVGGPLEEPARIHGDLWAGNRLVDRDGASWLIDPAPYGGHRESDLAMMRLFGGFGPQAFAAYDEAFPLADGWEERVSLHLIAPLVVHAVKFGGSYVDAATAAINRYG